MLCGEGNLLPEIEDEESDDSDFELDSSSNKETSTKSENEEQDTSNKEIEPLVDPNKAHRDALFQHIFSSSNPNNRPTYVIPSANNKLKNAECDICIIK